MDKREAFQIVLNELWEIPLFRGIYDARNGKEEFMHGVDCVMEAIAYHINDDVGDYMADAFIDNLIASEEWAKVRRA